MRIAFILFVTHFVAADEGDFEKSWNDYEQQFNKKYSPTEVLQAKTNFKTQLTAINIHNNRYAAGLYNYTIGINEFSDSDLNETLATLCQTVYTPYAARSLPLVDLSTLLPGPLAIDWTSLLQPIVNQGQCGSCWAYSTVAQFEAFYRQTLLFYNYKFSPQYLIDCSLTPPNSGCSGGWPRVAMGSG